MEVVQDLGTLFGILAVVLWGFIVWGMYTKRIRIIYVGGINGNKTGNR